MAQAEEQRRHQEFLEQKRQEMERRAAAEIARCLVLRAFIPTRTPKVLLLNVLRTSFDCIGPAISTSSLGVLEPVLHADAQAGSCSLASFGVPIGEVLIHLHILMQRPGSKPWSSRVKSRKHEAEPQDRNWWSQVPQTGVPENRVG